MEPHANAASESIDRRVLRLDERAFRWITLAVALMTLAAVALIAQALLLSQTISQVFRSGQTLGAVVPLVVLLLLLIGVRAALQWGGEVIAQRSASRIKRDLRVRLLRRLGRRTLPTSDERSGELAHTVVDGVEALDEYVTQYQTARLLAALVPALVFLVVLWLDPLSALILAVAGPLLVLLLAVIGSRTKDLSERRFAELRWMSAHFLDMLQGLTTLKLFGRSKEQTETIAEISERFGRTTMQVLRTAFQTSLALEWASVAATALVAVQVSLRLMDGLASFDRALAVLLLTPEFFLPLRQLALKYHVGTTGKAAAQRIFALLDTSAPQVAPAWNGATITWVPDDSDLRFENVHLAYDSGTRPALRGLTMTIPHGKTMALVGATGAGKTTVARLLLRFVEPSSGAIFVSGRPLMELDPYAWRARIGWISQQPRLFYGTVADNLRLARPAASQEEMEEAARMANALDFIRALPQGFETPVYEGGARLSGGQRQRLAIARALLKDAPLLILDEATAHLDAESEALVREALNRLAYGRTTLIIAHRLEMAYGADQIVVLDRGQAVEMGDHHSLLATGEFYQALVASYEREAAR
ncbi:MAG TPA: thiol reductant ABC exporter subunit CydD [Ktedonobacterales bacterium]|nr:thiol reductant ABC exporter subunit CydD [Ktedonobacterales bacterium]